MKTSLPRQEASLLSWFVFGAALFLTLATGIDNYAPWLPFLLSVGIFGLSHGAVDWVLLKPRTKSAALGFFFAYALVGLMIGIGLWAFPAATVVVFFILTIVHFGIADERDLCAHDHGEPRTLSFSAGGIARITLFLSLVCFSGAEEVVELFRRVVRLSGSPYGQIFQTGLFRELSFVIFCLASVVWISGLGRLIVTNSSRGTLGVRGRLSVEIGEAALLLSCGLFLHPVYAVGLYFLCWHALRHTLLVAKSRMVGAGRDTGLMREMGSLQIKSWPFSVPVLPLILWLVWENGNPASPSDWVASFLIVCVVFTLPHHLIVERRFVVGLSGGDSPGEEVSDIVRNIDSDELNATIGRPYRGQI